jgi:phosphopentomutase
MDVMFRAARSAGMMSVLSCGVVNYDVFTTPDFHYGTRMEDAVALQHAIDHLKNDHARLLRIHLQRIRDFWTGPANRTDPASPYIKHLLEVDGLLGTLIQALKDVGVWQTTYLVVSADHGMGQTSASENSSPAASSWQPFMSFLGPDLKKGATIPYAELPDVAVTTVRFFGLPPLRGHLDPRVTLPPALRGPTGTVLTNLFVGAPAEIPHPRYVEACLALGAACMGQVDDYSGYRQAMLGLIK